MLYSWCLPVSVCKSTVPQPKNGQTFYFFYCLILCPKSPFTVSMNLWKIAAEFPTAWKDNVRAEYITSMQFWHWLRVPPPLPPPPPGCFVGSKGSPFAASRRACGISQAAQQISCLKWHPVQCFSDTMTQSGYGKRVPITGCHIIRWFHSCNFNLWINNIEPKLPQTAIPEKHCFLIIVRASSYHGEKVGCMTA